MSPNKKSLAKNEALVVASRRRFAVCASKLHTIKYEIYTFLFIYISLFILIVRPHLAAYEA